MVESKYAVVYSTRRFYDNLSSEELEEEAKIRETVQRRMEEEVKDLV